jgi:hypothetical protein
MATIASEAPDGVAEEAVDADGITDSGTVQGSRATLEDGSSSTCRTPECTRSE